MDQKMQVLVLDKMKVGGAGWFLQLQSIQPGNIRVGDIYTNGNSMVTIKTLESQDHTDVDPEQYTHPSCFWVNVRSPIIPERGDTLIPYTGL